MKNIFLLFVYIAHTNAYSQLHYWQQQVNYVIDVTLNDTEHTLDAFEKIEYFNNSPDTLSFLWFHIWPNAYKNDKTAFSEQLLLNDRTDFYFSDKEQRGYINRLDFKVNGSTAKIEDHPEHIDIIKIILPQPLPPGKSISITTPFHVKLPHIFSRSGHAKQSYQVTQWYPKPAVYDHKGWHPMPYLEQGEFYSEFGDYDVRITLPANYIVAATGELQDTSEFRWLKEKAGSLTNSMQSSITNGRFNNRNLLSQTPTPASSPETKTLRYLQRNVHDFAWFADKRFIVNNDTLKLLSGRVIRVFSFYHPEEAGTWKNSLQFVKDAVQTRSKWIGEYPFNVVSAVAADMGSGGGMEYLTITSIAPMNSEREVDETIAHEVGHNWFYGMLANNEREHPWMDEGMNTFYDTRYNQWKYNGSALTAQLTKKQHYFLSKKLPDNPEDFLFETVAAVKKDQPINTPAQKFTQLNYFLVTYFKTGRWMAKLENSLGRETFDSCMHEYYRQWQFKHPYPEDFKELVKSVSGKSVELLFEELDKKGSLLPAPKKSIRFTSFFNLNNTNTTNYISVAPAIGANMYDGFMIGGLIHNYQLPLNRFSFFVLPLYALESKKINGIGKIAYKWYPERMLSSVEIGINAAKFSMDEFTPEGKEKLFMRFQKVSPYFRITFNQGNPLNKVERYVQFKSLFINEGQLEFKQVISGSDTGNLVNIVSRNRNLNQLRFVIQNHRILYPYKGEFQLEQQKEFFRLVFTGKYFFNYASGKGGVNLRFFAGKFIYNGARTAATQFATDRYHLNLSGANGYEDYTYSNFFVGRNKFEGWGSQQMMMRDGGFKVTTSLLSSKIGKTDNWLVAANIATDIPGQINPLQLLPVKIPLKLFADIGSYGEAWKKNEATGKFLFDAGLQLSLVRETLNIYIPLIYSSVFKDYFRSTLGNNRFLKTIAFSIDIQDLHLKKINRNIPF